MRTIDDVLFEMLVSGKIPSKPKITNNKISNLEAQAIQVVLFAKHNKDDGMPF